MTLGLDSFTQIAKSCLFVCFPDQKKAKGEELFDQIMYHLDIVEKDYFGLRFMDSAQVPVRMEPHHTIVSSYFELLVFHCHTVSCLSFHN